MSTAAMPQPIVPPRPSRSQDKDTTESSAPKIPPRPARRLERSISPEGRFAPSPLKEAFSKSPKAIRFSPQDQLNEYTDDPIDRSGSVAMPDIGEEGNEYAALSEEMKKEEEKSRSPAQTRSVGDDLKLHAPKPSLPAHSAKQRVQAVTRTDSDNAASYGIGRPSSAEPKSIHKKRSSTSQLSNEDRDIPDDKQGIPEIGQRVPMLSNAGDVQAPSPSPALGPDGRPVKHHYRKGSARDLPPGSYGMHGHSVVSTDKLSKAYYEKHPDALTKEYNQYNDRQNDFAMSSTDLNKIVRETVSRGAGLGTSEFHGTPSEEIGYQAHEYATSRPGSTAPNVSSPPRDKDSSSQPQINVSSPEGDEEDQGTVHVDDYRKRSSVTPAEDNGEEDDNYKAPILADDEVAKDPGSYMMEPAVELPPERRGSVYEMEEAPSRPTSRPTSLYRGPSYQEFESTPLEDVDEYEPLFDDEGNEIGQKPVEPKAGPRHKFPSKDVWEDAPSSVHYTAEVSTPDETENQRKAREAAKQRAETPAEAFAKHQEELAEKEARSSKFVPRGEKQSTWLPLQPHPNEEARTAPRRFPSKDVWEDTPESLLHETTVSTPQSPEAEAASRSKPALPERPKPKQTSSDDKMKPPTSDKPKPQIPARPAKASSSAEGPEPPRAKPAVPARPMGGKIAALQAGFMSDLNKRLQIGPQAPKKEDAPAAEEVEEKEKAPLLDARKSRARGPQRRAPAKSPSPAAPMGSSKAEGPSLSFVIPQTIWSIDPEDSTVTVDDDDEVEEKDVKEDKEEKVETLATNMAGEKIVEAKVEKEGDEIKPVDVEETAKD